MGTKTSFYGFTVNTMKNSLISYAKLGFTSVPQGQVRPAVGEPWWTTVVGTVFLGTFVWGGLWGSQTLSSGSIGSVKILATIWVA